MSAPVPTAQSNGIADPNIRPTGTKVTAYLHVSMYYYVYLITRVMYIIYIFVYICLILTGAFSCDQNVIYQAATDAAIGVSDTD